MKTLKIYKSSAGSGKTFTLVLEYLKLVLRYPEDYKSILAITFTNKAADEMKNRIIEALVALANGENNSIRTLLEDELPGKDLTLKAAKALKNILHDYSSFSVSTIDSFFQRILRALAREVNLPLNMQVEVEIDDAILDVTDRLLKDVGVDKDLTEWLTELAIQKMNDEKGWNLEKDIDSVARELFKEEHHNRKVLSREEIHQQYKKLQAIKKTFEKKMKEFGEHALLIIQSTGLNVEDFSYGKGGVAGYFLKISSAPDSDNYKQGKRVDDAVSNAEKWASKSSKNRSEIIDLAESALIPKLNEILNYRDSNFKDYLTASEILRKIYLFGIVNDLQKKFTEYRNENNVILLSDTTRLLSDVIDGSDAPFLYEKTGNRYKHLLIDEFQDTSLLQWKNLLPLIINALGSGFTTLVVGDAKQSIYRWRGGNMNLLLRDLFIDLKNFKSLMKEEVLSTNYRSKKEVVEFNNDFFSNAPLLIAEEIEMNDFPPLKLAYDPGLKQNIFSENESGGYVKIRFLTSTEAENEEEEKTGWKENAMIEMLANIKRLLTKGYSYKDICILVRKNTEGNEIANWLFDNEIHDIISPDSLLITASPKINFLINIFRYLTDNKNTISRSEIIYYYRKYISKEKDQNYHDLFADHKRKSSKSRSKNPKPQTLFEGLEENEFNRILPESFSSHLTYLGKLPVYELCEQLISNFSLNASPDAYIQRFQDLVLEYTSKTNSSLEGFLEWWDTSSKIQGTSVIIPGNTDAIRIMTIHSSKGLQFPIVMMPFTEWSIKLKANETIWMKTDGNPYEDLGVVAVASGSRLLDTYFSEEYSNEVNNAIVDNINLLYVALTRAEEKLYVSCPSDNGKDLNTISKLIYRTCKKVDETFSGDTLEKGFEDKKIAKPEKNKKIVSTELLNSYPITRWQDKLSLSTHSGDLLSMMEDKKMTKINYGILVHAVLAAIQKTSDIDLAIDKIVFDGLIGSEEKEHLKKEIGNVLVIPEIKKYFDESYEALAERELILPDGEVLRPDRVIVKNNHATVIDFKTGKREKKHEDQVNRYSDVLRKMKYDSVEGCIVYLAEPAIVLIEHE